jgi:hypothetical protein
VANPQPPSCENGGVGPRPTQLCHPRESDRLPTSNPRENRASWPLDSGPMPRGADWVEAVNAPRFEVEVESLRRCPPPRAAGLRVVGPPEGSRIGPGVVAQRARQTPTDARQVRRSLTAQSFPTSPSRCGNSPCPLRSRFASAGLFSLRAEKVCSR